MYGFFFFLATLVIFLIMLGAARLRLAALDKVLIVIVSVMFTTMILPEGFFVGTIRIVTVHCIFIAPVNGSKMTF